MGLYHNLIASAWVYARVGVSVCWGVDTESGTGWVLGWGVNREGFNFKLVMVKMTPLEQIIMPFKKFLK